MSTASDLAPGAGAAAVGEPTAQPGLGHETRPWALGVSIAVGLALWLVPTPSGLEPSAWRLFAIFLATIIGIIAKAAPMGALSVIAMAVCAATGVLAPDGDSGDRVAAALSGLKNIGTKPHY